MQVEPRVKTEQLSQLSTFPRQLRGSHLNQDAAQGPNIDLEVVGLLLEPLWGLVIDIPALGEGVGDLGLFGHLTGDSEVGELEGAV